MKTNLIRIGTRGSPLALRQAEIVQQALQTHHGLEPDHFEIIGLKTSGDRITDQPLIEFGGKGLFTKELEEALLEQTIDLAVHSMKDMATQLPDGLIIACMLPREDPRDVLIARDANGLEDLPPDARVGTSSLRRACQVLHARPDLKVLPLRGNVQTRLAKIEAGVAEATLLAYAGLKRLGTPELGTVLDTDAILPAVAQGALGIECREDNTFIQNLVAPLDHHPTSLCVQAERAFLRALDGSCRTPIAGLATLVNGHVDFTGLVASADGQFFHKQTIVLGERNAIEDAHQLGEQFYQKLKRYNK